MNIELRDAEQEILNRLRTEKGLRFSTIVAATRLPFRVADRAMQRLRKKGLVTFSHAEGWKLVAGSSAPEAHNPFAFIFGDVDCDAEDWVLA